MKKLKLILFPPLHLMATWVFFLKVKPFLVSIVKSRCNSILTSVSTTAGFWVLWFCIFLDSLLCPALCRKDSADHAVCDQFPSSKVFFKQIFWPKILSINKVSFLSFVSTYSFVLIHVAFIQDIEHFILHFLIVLYIYATEIVKKA